MSWFALLTAAWRWLKSIDISFEGGWKLRISFNKPKAEIEADRKPEIKTLS